MRVALGKNGITSTHHFVVLPYHENAKKNIVSKSILILEKEETCCHFLHQVWKGEIELVYK